MLPHLGQVANGSIEDGMALATLLAASPEEPERALLAYERIRKTRTDAIRHPLHDHDVLLEAQAEAAALR